MPVCFSRVSGHWSLATAKGRNGVWLAEQGLQVLSVDYSATGLSKAKALAWERNVSLCTECDDLTEWHWPQDEFDFVVIIYVHFPPEVRRQLACR